MAVFSEISDEISVPEVIENDNWSPSTSVATNDNKPEVSSSKLKSGTVDKTGESLTGTMVISTVAVSNNSPSVTLKTKLSVPLKFKSGV